MGTITTKDGTEIYYKDWGRGQPTVFSHGWPLSADDWDTQMLFFLKHGYRVIAHDRRGHGRSTQVSDGHDMDHYADDLAALTGHLDLKNAIHIGHSTGGGEVAHYLGRHGESRVAKAALIRVGSNSPPSPSRGLGESARVLGSSHGNPLRADGNETEDSTKYREEYADRVRKLGSLGLPLTDECLAKFLGVPCSTIALWKQTEPSFSQGSFGGGDSHLRTCLRLVFPCFAGKYREILALEAKDCDSGLAFAMEIQWIARKFPGDQNREIPGPNRLMKSI
jgi:pimeloyl-ACP methyl ester carboxylesterase